MPAAGGEAEEIPIGMLVGSDPGWSPDGRYLAFAGGDDAVDWDLWVWDFEARGLIQLTDTRFIEQSPAWNAAGSEIVYAGFPDRQQGHLGGLRAALHDQHRPAVHERPQGPLPLKSPSPALDSPLALPAIIQLFS